MPPAGFLGNAVSEFELVLDELTSNFEFVRAATRLRPRLKDMLSWQTMDGDAKQLAQRFLQQRAAEQSVLYRGMVVSLSGAFEQFLARILRDCVLAMNATAGGYDAFSEAIRKQNVYRTGLAFQTIHEPLDHLSLDYETLSRNIGTCHAGSEEPVLNADAFAIFVSVVSPEKVSEALKRIGFQVNWDDFGRVPAMRDLCGKKDTRETANAVQEWLRKFAQTRNKIAHTGSSGIVVMDSDFEQFLIFFRTFGRIFGSAVEKQLAQPVVA